MRRNSRAYPVIAIALVSALNLCASPLFAGVARLADLNLAIANVEKALMRAVDMRDSGQMKNGRPFVAMITPTVKLSFSKSSFDRDIDKALKIHDRLAVYRARLLKSKRTKARKKSGENRIDAMMRSEKKTSALSPAPKGQVVEYDIYSDYRQSHDAKVRMEDQQATADINSVIAERQSAETELTQRLQRKQALQAQAMNWQEQMDKQASASARASAKWEKEHSFGAYARRFFGAVLQTAVGSFTTALLTPIASNLANQAVGQMFPEVAGGGGSAIQQAGASATQSTINSAAQGAGATVGQGAASAVTGNPNTYSTSTSSTATTASASAPKGGAYQPRIKFVDDASMMGLGKTIPDVGARLKPVAPGIPVRAARVKRLPKKGFISRYPGPYGWVKRKRAVRY